MQLLDGDGRLTSDLSQCEFKHVEIRELLGREDYLLIKRQVLDVENIVRRLVRCVRDGASGKDYMQRAASVVGEIWKRSIYKVSEPGCVSSTLS